MKVLLVLLAVLVTAEGLTREELASFKPRDPDHVDVHTGLKSEVRRPDGTDTRLEIRD